jgi:DNA-binding XRE family transcriptional regulator
MSRQLISNTEVLAEMLQDPQFRAEWERTALARAVAEAVIRYRAERGLSQTALARLLGWRQPVVARLEAAEHNPTMDILLTLARALMRSLGAKLGANDHRHRDTSGHVQPSSLQLDGTSGHAQHLPGTLRKCLLSSRFRVRVAVGAQVMRVIPLCFRYYEKLRGQLVVTVEVLSGLPTQGQLTVGIPIPSGTGSAATREITERFDASECKQPHRRLHAIPWCADRADQRGTR